LQVAKCERITRLPPRRVAPADRIDDSAEFRQAGLTENGGHVRVVMTIAHVLPRAVIWQLTEKGLGTMRRKKLRERAAKP